MASFVKDPDEVLDYTLDWSVYLPDGDTVQTASWTIPAGISESTEDGHEHSVNGKFTTVWLAGGTEPEDYLITCRIVSAQGRQVERTFEIAVRSR